MTRLTPHRFTDEESTRIIAMAQRGMKPKAIAQVFPHLSARQVYGHLQGKGIAMGNQMGTPFKARGEAKWDFNGMDV